MNKANLEYIVVGKLGTAYGIKGWLKVLSYTKSIEDILEYDPWYLEDNDSWKLVDVLSARPHGKGIVAHLAGLNSPEQARLLTGKKIAVKRSQLPDLAEDEHYWSDLIGLTVINTANQVLGTVSYLIETGANDVLIIKDANNKEHGIPYLKGSVIIRVDLSERIIQVDWDLI